VTACCAVLCVCVCLRCACACVCVCVCVRERALVGALLASDYQVKGLTWGGKGGGVTFFFLAFWVCCALACAPTPPHHPSFLICVFVPWIAAALLLVFFQVHLERGFPCAALSPLVSAPTFAPPPARCTHFLLLLNPQPLLSTRQLCMRGLCASARGLASLPLLSLPQCLPQPCPNEHPFLFSRGGRFFSRPP